MSTTLTDNAVITAEGQITIPENIREVLGVANGGTITFVVEDGEIKMVNPFTRALREFQKAMEGEAERVGWTSDDDVVEFIMEMRRKRDENIY